MSLMLLLRKARCIWACWSGVVVPLPTTPMICW